jgi:hypothetical protein
MRTRHRRNLFAFIALLLLAGIEFGCSLVPFDRSLRPLLVVPAIGMVGLVAICFMRIGTGPTLARGFAIAGLFWLTILLGLGMMDPLTRAVYPVQVTEPP